MRPYSIVIQAGPEEILGASCPAELCIQDILDWPNVSEAMVIMPDIEAVQEAKEKLDRWGVESYVGDSYNVCRRMMAAYERLSPQAYYVRVLAIWKHVDMEYVDRLVEEMQAGGYHMVSAPLDYDLTMAADVASAEIIQSISELEGTTQEAMRARFNPWGYIEMHSDSYKVKHLEPAPVYGQERIAQILAQHRCHPENEFFGRDYAGSRYHYINETLDVRGRVLDIACGSGFGSSLLSEKAEFVLGVDYLDSYVKLARDRYPESGRLKFMQGNGETFLYEGKENQFDTVISLHTLEHVHDDEAMLRALRLNLKEKGLLILEVPKLFSRPLGVPINPYHLREYTQEQIVDLVRNAGFQIEQVIGCCRSFYGNIDQARCAIQIRAVRL